MKKLLLGALSFLMIVSMPFAWAETEKLITLEEASKAAGLNSGAHQGSIREGIVLKQLASGVAEAYSTKPTDKRLQKAREHTAINRTFSPQASADLGVLLAVENQAQLKTLNVSAFMDGFKRGYTQTLTSPELATAAMVASKFIQQQRMLNAEEQLTKSKEFLAQNAKREGVIVTKSGLQYEILAQGSGPNVTWKDMVKVNYRSTKPNSNYLYDSSKDSGPTTFAMRGDIPEGWRELFALMNKGSCYRVYLSPDLGFGVEGEGDAVLPNEVLITEFTLLDIIPPPPVVE